MRRLLKMMSDAASAVLREAQARIETAAANATTRNELINLRALWGDIERALQVDKEK